MKFLVWLQSLFSQRRARDGMINSAQDPSTVDKIRDFVEHRLGGQNVPTDLAILLAKIVSEAGFQNSAWNPLHQVGGELLWTDKQFPLLDHDYINDEDRADPATMANVRAMQDTDKMLKFVIQVEDTSLLGYWQPDPKIPLEKCPLYWLDTEGQYQLAEGKSLAETLVYRATTDGDDDTARSLIDAFARLGVIVSPADEASIFGDMDCREASLNSGPEAYRALRYDYYRSVW